MASKPAALVIANAEYQKEDVYAPLSAARRDGQAVADLFRRAGYDVIECFDATRTDMEAMKKQLFQKLSLSQGAIVPIYFAGHGIEVAGEQYLAPVDARTRKPEDNVALSSFLRMVKTAHMPAAAKAYSSCPVYNATFFIIIDACRALLKRDEREICAVEAAALASQPSFRQQEARASFAVFHACEQGDFSQEDPRSGHGFFTQALIKCGRNQSLTIQTLIEEVSRSVREETTKLRQVRPSIRIQLPWVDSGCSELSELYLWVSRSRMPSDPVSDDSLSEGRRRDSSLLSEDFLPDARPC